MMEALRNEALILLATSALISACHASHTGSDRQLRALGACFDRWEENFPELRPPADRASSPKLGGVMFDQVEFDDYGNFFVEQPLAGTGSRVGPPTAVCRGNDKAREITFVGWNDEIKRPKANQKWTFE
ncbi:MAG: hypothetical protein ABIQ32_08845 [Sphingomicrobium sp.]